MTDRITQILFHRTLRDTGPEGAVALDKLRNRLASDASSYVITDSRNASSAMGFLLRMKDEEIAELKRQVATTQPAPRGCEPHFEPQYRRIEKVLRKQKCTRPILVMLTGLSEATVRRRVTEMLHDNRLTSYGHRPAWYSLP